MGIPDNFVQPLNHVQTSSPWIMKPVFGTVNQQFVRFFISYEYDENKSQQLNYEHMEPVEMCEITNDRFTKCCKRVVDLQMWQKQAFAELYTRFKNQEDSLDTEIYAWVAIKPSEKALLEHCGFSSVEQIASASSEIIARLGPGGKDLQEKAIKHVNAKGEKIKASEFADQIGLLRAELEAEKRRSDEKLDAFFKLQEAKAAQEKKPGRPKKIKESDEEINISL